MRLRLRLRMWMWMWMRMTMRNRNRRHTWHRQKAIANGNLYMSMGWEPVFPDIITYGDWVAAANCGLRINNVNWCGAGDSPQPELDTESETESDAESEPEPDQELKSVGVLLWGAWPRLTVSYSWISSKLVSHFVRQINLTFACWPTGWLANLADNSQLIGHITKNC